jgi:hypothetical protein
MARTNYLIAAGILLAGAVGCGEGTTPPGPGGDGGPSPDGGMDMMAQPVEQAQSAQRSAQYASDVVRQLGGAIGFGASENGVLSRLAGNLMGMRQSSDMPPTDMPQALPAPLPEPILSRLFETPSFKSLRPRPGFLALATPEENFDETAADIEAMFKTRLFVAGNVESSTSTSITYLLKGDPTCRPLPSEIADGRLDRVDLKCSADLAKLQVRIVLTGDGDGYRFQILLGPQKYELSVFIIHSDLLAWEADLNMAKMATQYANMVLAGDAERRSEPFPFATLKGRVKVALKKLGDKKASLSWSVLEAIEIQDMNHHSFAMKPADPAMALTGDGVAKTITLKLAFPQTDLRAPWDPQDMGAQNSDLHVAIGGLHGESTLSEMAEELSFVGLGLAPSFVEVRTTKIFELGFNTTNANKMDLKIKPITGDQARFEITPRFDLSLKFGLESVASEFSSPPDSALQGQTYSIKMTGGSRVVVETMAETETFDGGFKMVEGSLQLSTSADTNATVDVATGNCLTENPEPAEGTHPILGKVMEATCQ